MINRQIQEIDESTLSKTSRQRLQRTRIKWVGKKLNKLTILSIRYVRDNRQPTTVATCQCECGNTCESFLTLITRNLTTSCGCWNALKQMKPHGEAAMRACFSSRRADAKRRQLEWSLSIQEYDELTQKTCHYCNRPPSNEYGSKMYNGNFKYNGLDRLNNLVGYRYDNCVPCCKECNHSKGTMTVDEFKQHILNIYNNFIRNNGSCSSLTTER